MDASKQTAPLRLVRGNDSRPKSPARPPLLRRTPAERVTPKASRHAICHNINKSPLNIPPQNATAQPFAGLGGDMLQMFCVKRLR